MSFPTFEAATAVFGNSLEEKIVISTWWFKCKPEQPKQDLFCEGTITKVEAHFNPGKNEVEIHGYCQGVKNAWKLCHEPPHGYRKNVNK